MSTVLEIVTRAFRKLDVSGVGDVLQADEIAEGVDALNGMMHAWKLRSVDLEHTDLAAEDDFSLGPEFEEGTIYLLAERLSPNYSRPRTFDADEWFRSIQAVYARDRAVVIPSALLRMPSQRRRC